MQDSNLCWTSFVSAEIILPIMITINNMWPSAKPCAVKPSWMKEMWLPLSSNTSYRVCPWNHPDSLHSAAACLWFQCHGQLMCDKFFIETCLQGFSHAWSLLLPAVGPSACWMFSLEGLLCGPLVLPGDLPVGGRGKVLPTCVSHITLVILAFVFAYLCVCSKVLATFQIVITSLLHFLSLYTQ